MIDSVDTSYASDCLDFCTVDRVDKTVPPSQETGRIHHHTSLPTSMQRMIDSVDKSHACDCLDFCTIDRVDKKSASSQETGRIHHHTSLLTSMQRMIDAVDKSYACDLLKFLYASIVLAKVNIPPNRNAAPGNRNGALLLVK